MSLDRSDDAVLGRLIERSRLLIALSDEIPTETKLQTQPLLKQMDQLMAAEAGARDVGRIRATHAMLLDELADYADLDALVQAMTNFLPEQ